jgi:hypothetical protein
LHKLPAIIMAYMIFYDRENSRQELFLGEGNQLNSTLFRQSRKLFAIRVCGPERSKPE